MDFHSESDQKAEEVDDEEYKDRDYPARQEGEGELEETRYQQRFIDRKKNKADAKSVHSPSRSRRSKKKEKLDMFWVKLIFKILVVAAVCYNFKFILDFMKYPDSNFTHILFVVGICAGINFIAVWILFYKKAFIRFYLSIIAIVGSFAYYFYVNYTNYTFLGDNIIPSILVLISVFMAINPKVNYYLRSIVFLLIPIFGIYFSGNKFALVWILMFNAGLILLLRVSKSTKSKSNKMDEQTRRNKKQSA